MCWVERDATWPHNLGAACPVGDCCPKAGRSEGPSAGLASIASERRWAAGTCRCLRPAGRQPPYRRDHRDGRRGRPTGTCSRPVACTSNRQRIHSGPHPCPRRIGRSQRRGRRSTSLRPAAASRPRRLRQAGHIDVRVNAAAWDGAPGIGRPIRVARHGEASPREGRRARRAAACARFGHYAWVET